MVGHIAGGVSTAYYVHKHILDETKVSESFTISEELARLKDSMATATVSSYVQNY